MTNSIKQRFDYLLHSMMTNPVLEMPAQAVRTSSAAASAGCDGTQTLKGRSAVTSEKRGRKSPEQPS